MKEVTDITVIGAGPVGLFTTFYAGMREASVHLIDSMPDVGGQLSALYPEKFIYDIAGLPKIKAQVLVDQLYEQALTFAPKITLGKAVLRVRRCNDVFEIITTDEVYYTKTIIITAGAGAFEPRKLEIDNEASFPQNIHYFIQDLSEFKNECVLVCGGGDSAIDWALALEPIAKEVILVHRRNEFRAHESSLTQLKNSTVKMITPFAVREITGHDGNLAEVILQEVRGNERISLQVEQIIVSYGFITNLGPLKEWDLAIERNSLLVNQQMETNIAGIYAAGDICLYKGKPKLIATGFGEATIAVNQAKRMIDPQARVNIHSTHLFDEVPT